MTVSTGPDHLRVGSLWEIFSHDFLNEITQVPSEERPLDEAAPVAGFELRTSAEFVLLLSCRS